MTDRATLEALLARVEKATGPDRELDRAIWVAIVGPVDTVKELGGHQHQRWYDKNHVRYAEKFTRLTAYFTAVLMLVEKVLPGWLYSIEQGDPTCSSWTMQQSICRLRPRQTNDEGWQSGVSIGNHSLPVFAILTALLRAMIAERTSTEGEQ